VFLLENVADRYLLEDSSGFYQREEIALAAESSQVVGLVEVSGEGTEVSEWIVRARRRGRR